ncbi:MarR family transcriptional regulator [Arthrobacter sp. Sa2CUA1]|uniref:MarR family transcriptional regulator n=1 Tax=Arthrobacter gallicola TaxID=2762225 RepID=A0ABR8UR40_9MICC|nr:MarR family transcriptional regulator [Arthrobacter gallicola]MBD7995008.1 MarR family transcriptional regulator [Arthrobacter gallicola]
MESTENQTLTEAAARLTFSVQARLSGHAATAGLSVQQARLLGFLRDREPTINEIAAGLGLDKSSASGLVDRAARRGLVGRTQNASDGRSVRILLLPEGRELIEAANRAFEEDMHQLFSGLTPGEVREWTVLTYKLLSHDGEGPAPV